MKTITAAAAALLLTTAFASAQTTTTPGLTQHLKDNLAKAGFTDVNVIPRSFLVQAKDKDGNPVMMVINPDSIEVVKTISSTPNASSGEQQ